ncbi:MAG TPA: hypothetical protein VKD47_09540 [Miltoncostaeaceae bacterium]|nr:hypothetical protein [Miltoncostaeaceae bacterium]
MASRYWPAAVALALGGAILAPAFALSANPTDSFIKTGMSPGLAQLGIHELSLTPPDPAVVDATRAPGEFNPLAPGGVGKYNLLVTQAGVNTTTFGYAVDNVTRFTQNNVSYPVTVQQGVQIQDIPVEVRGALIWLLSHTGQLIASSNDADRTAATIQVAVWILDGKADPGLPTNDDGINADALALVQMAKDNAATAQDQAIALDGPVGIVAAGDGCGGTITLSGPAGEIVFLMVTSADGTVSKQEVILDQNGSAVVNVSATATGVVTVHVTGQGTELSRLDGLAQARDTDPEQIITLLGGFQADANVPVNCEPPPPPGNPPPGVPPPGVPPPGVPPGVVPPGVTPPGSTPPGSTPPGSTPPGGTPASVAAAAAGGVVAAPTRTRLAIDKRGPATAKAGSVITYTIKITNVGKITARRVVLRDAIPADMGLAVRAKGVTIQDGSVVVSLGNMRPKASRTIKLKMRINRSAFRAQLNVASASAANAGRVADDALTRLQRIEAVRAPAVTG